MKIGFRIEFFRDLQPDGSATDLAAATWIEDAFDVTVLPSIGEFVSGWSLVGTIHGSLIGAHGVPFARVRQIEHYPVGPHADSGDTPGVMVVVRAPELSGTDWARLTSALRNAGWNVSDYANR